MITLDTNAVLYYFKSYESIVKLIDGERQRGEHFLISTITEVELFSQSHISVQEMLRIAIWLNSIYILTVDSQVARRAAQVRRDFKLKTPDAIIAATALLNGGKLITADAMFKKVKGI